MAWPTVFTGERAGPDRKFWARRIFPFALFLLALAPRLVAINRYITPDELLWVYRSVELREAVRDGRWADTLVAGHPGVTTTWLGAAAISTQLAVDPSIRADYEWLTRLAALLPDNVTAFTKLSGFLTTGRMAVALVNSLSVVLVFFLIRRLWGGQVAALAALLLALDPFTAGLSGLMHVDALSASFATLALLALGLAATWPDTASSRGFLGLMAAAGVATGLAILTKTPAIMLGVVAAAGFGVQYIRLGGPLLSTPRRRLYWGVGVYGLAAGLTALILLPALWAAPATVLSILSGNANRHLDEALRPTFFLGRVAFVHGPLFYPVVLLWRLSPLVIAAAVPFILMLWERRGRPSRSSRSSRPSTGKGTLIPLLLLVVWCLLFVTLITVAAKKFDRYVLPVIPALIILASLAWVLWLRRRGARPWAVWALVAAQAIYLLLFVGYPLAAYNPLVGGPYTAVRVLPVGWGEGISAAGRWVSATQPGAADETAMAGVPPSLAPFFPGQTLVEGFAPASAAGYLIHTLGGTQLATGGSEVQAEGLELLQTIRYGGLDQGWVYRNPAPQPIPQPPPLADPLVFGERMALTAVGTEFANDLAHVTATWQKQPAIPADGRLAIRIAIVDAAGLSWAVQETDLLNAVYFYPPDWDSPSSGVVHTFLELSPATPPDTYGVVVTVLDSATGETLPARSTTGTFLGVEIPVGTVTVPRSPQVVSAARVQIPESSSLSWLDGALQLLGTSVVPGEALAGSRLPLDLFWHAPEGGLPAGLHVRWSLLPNEGGTAAIVATQPLSRLDTIAWRAGETINEKAAVALPPMTPSGPYRLTLDVLDAGGEPIGVGGAVGNLTINNIDREFDLPADLPLTLDTCFGEVLCLHGVDPAERTLSPGQTADLTLIWQATADPGQVYTVFLHVVDAAGNIVIQADHWPGGLPTDILAAGQVITDRVEFDVLALPAGRYDLRLGLYNTASGRRLPITSSAVPADDDALVLSGYFTVTAP
jgi:4-amino-4-deoxy-L-arabinose transferase-like glycosyltransferase